MAAAAAAKTASMLNAAFVHGTHLFEIAGYNALKAPGRSDRVTSGTFRVAGRDWNVVCSFNGRLTDISLVLAEKKEGDDGSVSATVSFSIDDPTGGRKPMKIGSRDEENTVFTHNSRFYKVDVPEEAFHKLEARYVKDDRLQIRCAVRVLEKESGPTRYCFVAAPPPPDITRFLRVLLDSGQRADVTFAVEGSCPFDAHRLVLAMRSPVFRAKFFGDSRDSSREWFRVHDVSAAVFRAMLHFIYTDELPPAADGEAAAAAAMAQDLLVAADLYGLDRLRLMCARMLWERVRTDGGVGSAISTLALVNGRDNCRQLQDLCVGYVADDWEAATATEEYRELRTTRPALLSDVLEAVIAKQLLHGHRPPSPSSGIAATTTPTHKSASVYRPSEILRGTHQLTVLGHSVVRRTHGVGEFVCSGAFEVGGHEWRLVYYPSGYDDEHDGYEAVFLQAMTPIDPDVVLEASGTINFVGRRSESKSEDDSGNTMGADFCSMADFWHTCTVDEPAAGYRWLNSSGLVGPNDCLTVECSFDLQVSSKTNPTATVARGRLLAQEQDMVVPPPSISWHLERLLEDGVGSDVTFSVDDGEFHAHTLVLTQRAPALLLLKEAAAAAKSKKKKKKDKKKTMICIDGIKAVVFKALLHFVYTDELPPLDDLLRGAAGAGEQPSSWASSRTRLAGDLLAAAERFQLVERMRPLCENLLCEAITPENAAATLELARRHGRPELRAFCLHYMTSPGVFKAVVASEGYQALPADALRDIVAQVAH